MSGNRSRGDNLSVLVADRFRHAIARGEYPRGLRLPPEPELAQRTGVSRATLREALRVLEREGLVTRRQKAGTIVSSRPIVHNSLERNFSVRETIVIFTIDHIHSAIVECATAPLLPEISFYQWLQQHCEIAVTHGIARIEATSATGELASRLGTNPGAPLFQLSQVDYTEDGLPVLYSEEFHVADAFDVTVVRTGPYA